MTAKVRHFVPVGLATLRAPIRLFHVLSQAGGKSINLVLGYKSDPVTGLVKD